MTGSLPTTRLVVAGGVEIRDGRAHKKVRAEVEWLKTRKTGPDTYEIERPRRVYEISFVYTKGEFDNALDRDGAIVVYDGHSRYGQGPAFGGMNVPSYPEPAKYPENPWSNHFRMGYEAVRTPCLADIWHHGVQPREFTTSPVPKSLFAPDFIKSALAREGRCKDKIPSRRPLLGCVPDLLKKLETVDITPHPESLLRERNYWYRAKQHEVNLEPLYIDRDGYIEYSTIVESSSEDLARVQLKCSLLYMNSCLSKWHYYEALKRRKTAVGSRCVFYLTNESPVARSDAVLVFLRQLLADVDPLSSSGSKATLTKINEKKLAGSVEMLL